ncbi:ComEC/Rec2 family competence protein [Paenibacillus swuensis]|uniref:ComEC/Rec2 family competence protein n=1 Tax=Paenibacillus swuensis TaxID=1178515 RepID=UPI0009EDF900|nr:ComEC/Rec2 family competence protein [Paenibacillus swuensis]
MRRPLVVFTVHCVLGCWAALSLQGFSYLWTALPVAGMIPLLLKTGRLSFPQALVCMLGFLLASIYADIVDQQNYSLIKAPAYVEEMEVEITGIVVSKPERDGDRVLLNAYTKSVAAGRQYSSKQLREKVQVYIKLEREDEISVVETWKRGDTIFLKGALRTFGKARNFGGFDYGEYLRLHRVTGKCKPKVWTMSVYLRQRN